MKGHIMRGWCIPRSCLVRNDSVYFLDFRLPFRAITMNCPRMSPEHVSNRESANQKGFEHESEVITPQ